MGSIFSGITGKSFHSARSASDVLGIEVGVAVLVGTGVIGEYFFGFCVAVGSDAAARAGYVCVGLLTGVMTDSGVLSPVQAVINTQTIKVRIKRRFIRSKYSEGKLISDEILCYRVPHDT